MYTRYAGVAAKRKGRVNDEKAFDHKEEACQAPSKKWRLATKTRAGSDLEVSIDKTARRKRGTDLEGYAGCDVEVPHHVFVTRL
ncbi:MAG TPA: hypothetical protein VJ023_00770 [Pyrinomonadaceae bacterium]|nr:hypothetical protein [Pyrinomonadaceae bacterium]